MRRFFIIVIFFAIITGCKDVRKQHYPNGQLESEHEFKDGAMHGKAVWYYETGEVEYRGQYIDGKSEGLFQYYYPNSQLEKEVTYVNGEEEGIFKVYYETGALKTEAPFKRGKQDGILKEYYESGQLKGEKSFLKGVGQGSFIFYHPNGQLKMDAYLENGKTVYYKEYDDQGKMIDWLYDFIFNPPIDTIYAGQVYNMTMRRTGPPIEMIYNAEIHIKKRDSEKSDTTFHLPGLNQHTFKIEEMEFTYAPKEPGKFTFHAYYMEKDIKDTLIPHYTKDFVVLRKEGFRF